ncbi:MAG: hypothetical protein Q9186_003086 [Xanthomendoza sp. 1 TL-2023]
MGAGNSQLFEYLRKTVQLQTVIACLILILTLLAIVHRMSLKKSSLRKPSSSFAKSGRVGHRKTPIHKGKAEDRNAAGPKKSVGHNDGEKHTYNFRPIRAFLARAATSHYKSDSHSNTRDTDPENYPDLNFHHTFGSSLTRKNPVSKDTDPDIAWYWDLLSRSPSDLQYHIYQICDRYRKAFRAFFNADPISLHGHVSDASNAALLTSVISHLVSHAESDIQTPFFDDEAKSNPRVAITEESYGAGYGCLAYHAVIDSNRPLANGPRPVVIRTHVPSNINVQVKKAKSQGCVALITEIVRAGDGKVISERAWKYLLEACEEHGLFLVVDEALTSIRCGAPFAYQLPQYSQHGYPDLVLFGKAVRTNGLAVEWRGSNILKLGIEDQEDRLFTILDWQERLTEMAQASDLLSSWGTLVLAKRDRWPQRAQTIGGVLRKILGTEGVKASGIGGLHSLLYLRTQDVARLRYPVMGAKAGKHLRWFPTMDEVMMSEEELRTKVFGAGSIPHRREVWAYLKSRGVKLSFCSRCGDAVGAEVESCEVCVVRVCEECEDGIHRCPILG